MPEFSADDTNSAPIPSIAGGLHRTHTGRTLVMTRRDIRRWRGVCRRLSAFISEESSETTDTRCGGGVPGGRYQSLRAMVDWT
jgi:hypothetical protein